MLLALLLAAALLWTPDRDRAELERKYLAAPQDMVSVLGTELHVRDSGPREAPAVLLLHGFGANSADYLKALPNAQWVALDGIGHLPQEEAPQRTLIPVRDFLRTATR